MFAMIHMTHLRRPLAAGLIAALLLGVTPALQAAGLPTVRVPVGDLALHSEGGQRELQRRLGNAVNQVCQPVGSALIPGPRARRLAQQCRERAWADIQVQLDRHGVALAAAARPVASVRRN
jgi:UrcA family protein